MKKFGLTGFPLGHSLSPAIHSRLFAMSGTHCIYELMEIRPEDLFTEASRLKQLDGFNVTIPHKTEIISLLDGLDEKAALFGAVNTVKVADGRLTGYNTDCTGFLSALALADLTLSGSVLICGAGGVARMIAYESVLAGCEVTVAVRASSSAKASKLRKEIREKLNRDITVTNISCVNGPFDLLVNGTPAGMYPKTDAMPVCAETVKACRAVFDTIYNPEETLLLKTCRENGIKCAGGMAMLVGQAAKAQEIWLGTHFTDLQILEVIGQTRKELEAAI